MILCCGEALIDMLPNQETNAPLQFTPHTGGAVFNTAIAIARLEQKVGLFTGLSTDFFGDLLRQDLEQNNVEYEASVTSNRATNLAFVTYQGDHAQYQFYDENSAGRMLTLDDLPNLPSDVSALFFGGISLAVEPCSLAYVDLMARASESHFIMVDPNIRPAFIADEEAYRDRLKRVFSQADIIKVSNEDLQWIYPELCSLEEQIQALFSMGLSAIFFTKGADGADAYLNSGVSCRVSGVDVDVVDTVGAGDTFNAGVLVALAEHGLLSTHAIETMQQAQLTKIVEFAVKAAGLSVTRAGASPPRRSDVLSENVNLVV